MQLCTEKKLTLAGAEKLFECELIHLSNGFGILKYVIQRNNVISGIKISPGDITYGLYWTDRPYTLYVWIVNEGKDRAYYFNIADRVSLHPSEFIWRDLVIDIVIDPGQRVHTLDRDELPADLAPDLSRYIQNTEALILRNYPAIIREAEDIVKALP